MKKQFASIFVVPLLLCLLSCETQDVKPVSMQSSPTEGTILEADLAGANKRVSNYVTHLSGDNEVPAVETKATGQVKLQLSKDGTELYYKLIVANIEDVTASHIHFAPSGVNGPVVAFLFRGPAPNPNGVLAEGVITDSDVINVPALAGSLNALVEAINAGNAYVNVHTSANPGGEIRGQIR
jgi:hypothetical protein